MVASGTGVNKMSVDHYAVMALGCRIDASKLMFSKRVYAPSCHHNIHTASDNFCSECGAKVSVNVSVFHNEYNECTDALRGLPVFWYDDDEWAVIASEYITTEMSQKMLSFNTISHPESAQKLKSALEPLNMWNEEQFGIWLITGCS